MLDQQGEYVGALVDAVEDIVTVCSDQLGPVPVAGDAAGRVRLRGTMSIDDQIAFVLRGAAGLVGAAG